MGKKIVLFDKLYNITSKTSEKVRKDVIIRYKKYLNEKVKGFPNTSIKIKKLREFDKRFEIIISGPEETFIYNILKKEIGSIHKFDDIKVGDILKGTMVDVGKVGFGIFVDCGIWDPHTDVLLNLHILRAQLCKKKETSLRNIIKTYDFMTHFPVYIKILEIDIDKSKLKGELDQQSLIIFNKVVEENLEGIFVSGATKSQVKKAIIRKGHLRDIITIKRFGFLENIILFKEGTDAPGIIYRIGNDLKWSKISAIRAEKIKSLIK